MIDILKKYKKSGKTSENESQLLDLMIQREEARLNAASSVKTSHAFIKIERVIPENPKMLFGNPVESRAFNRISIHASPEDTPFISVLVSETCLSMMTMGMNRSDTPAEMTLESVNGKMIDLSGISERSVSDIMISRIAEDMTQKSKDRALSFAETLRDLKRPLSKSDTHELSSAVSYGFSFIDGDFYADIYKQEENRRAAITRSEASNLMKCAHLLDAPEPESGVSVFDSDDIDEMRHLYERTHSENRITAKAVFYELISIAHEANVRDYDPRLDPKGDKLASKFKYNSPEAKNVKSLSEFFTRLCSKDIRELDETLNDPRHLIGEMSRISGRLDIHSDSGSDPDGFVAFRINSCEVSESFGRRHVRGSYKIPFFEVYITPTDLMMALRGDPDGDIFTRCTISKAFGVPVETVPYLHPLDNQIRELNVSQTPLSDKQKELGRNLSLYIKETGLKTAKDRAQAVKMSEEIVSGVDAASAEIIESFKKACDVVTDVVNDDLREKLEKMLTGKTAQTLSQTSGFGMISGPGD